MRYIKFISTLTESSVNDPSVHPAIKIFNRCNFPENVRNAIYALNEEYEIVKRYAAYGIVNMANGMTGAMGLGVFDFDKDKFIPSGKNVSHVSLKDITKAANYLLSHWGEVIKGTPERVENIIAPFFLEEGIQQELPLFEGAAHKEADIRKAKVKNVKAMTYGQVFSLSHGQSFSFVPSMSKYIGKIITVKKYGKNAWEHIADKNFPKVFGFIFHSEWLDFVPSDEGEQIELPLFESMSSKEMKEWEQVLMQNFDAAKFPENIKKTIYALNKKYKFSKKKAFIGYPKSLVSMASDLADEYRLGKIDSKSGTFVSSEKEFLSPEEIVDAADYLVSNWHFSSNSYDEVLKIFKQFMSEPNQQLELPLFESAGKFKKFMGHP